MLSKRFFKVLLNASEPADRSLTGEISFVSFLKNGTD